MMYGMGVIVPVASVQESILGIDLSEHYYMLIFSCTKPFINIISTVLYLSVCVFTKILYCGQSPIRVKVEHCSEL